MGSLQDLSTYLQDISNINIGIANNISTGLALEIGFKILQNVKISKIFEDSCSNHTIQYQINQNKAKPKAILFSSENSYMINEKIVTLFKKSLPKETHIQLVPHEYNRLLELGKEDSIFDIYDVILIFGTLNPNIENIAFLPLRDIVSSTEIDFITSALYPYLDKKDMREFKSQLLVNFSLQNIVGYLTILDAQTVIRFVNDAVQSIQDLLNITINFSESIGLFIHLSCIIERLVTNTEIIESVDLNEYSLQDQRNFNIIEGILQPISKHYGIVIPNNEIIYIHECLRNPVV